MKVKLVQSCVWCEKPMKKFGTSKLVCSRACKHAVNAHIAKGYEYTDKDVEFNA